MKPAPVKIQLTSSQAGFLDTPALFAGFVGGRGAGKSWIGAYKFFKRVKPRRLYTIAAPTYPMLRDTTFRSFQSMARLLRRPYTINKTDGIVTLSNGANVLLRTTNDPERLRGPNQSGFWLDEASLALEEAYDIALPSLREAGEQGWLNLTFTPRGKAHWTYKRLVQNDTQDTFLIHSHTRDNPFNPPNFAETLYRQYGAGLFARQELGGEFLDMGNTEWPSNYWEQPGFFVPAIPTNRTLRVLFYDGAGDARIGDKTGERKSDWNAVAILTITPDGHLWFDVRLWRGPQEMAAAELVRIAIEANPDLCGVESNFGGALLMPLIAAEAREQGRPDLVGRWNGVNNTLPKVTRIRRLGSYLARGLVHLLDTPGGRECHRQLEQFPIGDFDDGPDAMDGAVQLASHLLAA